MNILFLGAPGSGKSTQGEILAEKRGMKWISSGEMFRNSTDPVVVEILRTAQLVPDEITNKMVIEKLDELNRDNVILDGYPRTLKQAEFLTENNVKIDAIIEVKVPFEEILTRIMSRGREQDTEEIIRERVEIYEKSRDEIVAYFKSIGTKFIEVDGVGTIEEISKRVEEVI